MAASSRSPDVIKGQFARYELDPNYPAARETISWAFHQQGDLVHPDVFISSYNAGVSEGQQRSPYETTEWIEYEKQKKEREEKVAYEREKREKMLKRSPIKGRGKCNTSQPSSPANAKLSGLNAAPRPSSEDSTLGLGFASDDNAHSDVLDLLSSPRFVAFALGNEAQYLKETAAEKQAELDATTHLQKDAQQVHTEGVNPSVFTAEEIVAAIPTAGITMGHLGQLFMERIVDEATRDNFLQVVKKNSLYQPDLNLLFSKVSGEPITAAQIVAAVPPQGITSLHLQRLFADQAVRPESQGQFWQTVVKNSTYDISSGLFKPKG